MTKRHHNISICPSMKKVLYVNYNWHIFHRLIIVKLGIFSIDGSLLEIIMKIYMFQSLYSEYYYAFFIYFTCPKTSCLVKSTCPTGLIDKSVINCKPLIFYRNFQKYNGCVYVLFYIPSTSCIGYNC